ncbi:MAG: relaxase domain-containing protein [Williamsia sp.]|nr:relaxase domain-containing protein [Williamsia sp.]
MVQSSSSGQAKSYFSDALSKSDYYVSDQELRGRFNGRLAERLGLEEFADKQSFDRLCDNLNPSTGEPLTPRRNEERTVGYDINFHCPKSVSILHALAKDDHILEAFERSVSETMRDIEADTKVRVRKGGKNEDRQTGELAWAEFTHQTARPVEDQSPDPHLHSHCFVFNATWDETEKKFKAGKFKDIMQDMPYYKERFHKRLADRMTELGYRVRQTEKAFEIEGVPQKVVEHFSKRTDQIGRIAKEKGITDRNELDALGARTRAKKQKGMSMAELKAEWKRQMREISRDDANGEEDKVVRHSPVKEPPRLDVQKCIDHAVLHCFERASVMSERNILGTACKYAVGNPSITLEALTDAFRQDARIIQVRSKERTLCTTKGVLREEKIMVDLAREGQGKMKPLYKEAPDMKVDGQQRTAVTHVLTTPHRVSIIRGAAGTGKTTLMREAVEWMEKAGKTVTVVAPTSLAARSVLKKEGFEKAETVASLLVDENMQKGLKDQVLWVDEAGMLGTKDMTALLDIATKQNARLILGGDTRQHSSVVRGDALRILNTVGGIRAAEVSKIYRQKDTRYREVVEDLSKGNVLQGFQKLDEMQAIRTIDPAQANKELVEGYLAALKKGKTALVISPTHAQGDKVTQEIRQGLRAAGMIGKKETRVKRLANLNLTEAEKRDWRNFYEDYVIQFNQNVPGIKRGSAWTIREVTDGKIQLADKEGKFVSLPLDRAKDFDVYKLDRIPLSKGDKIRITRNGFDDQDKRLSNGMEMDVVSVDKQGKIMLMNKASKSRYMLDREFGHIAHAHCITSHSSQGKTVDEVFISQPSSTFGATDAKQFYVSVSRARDVARIYTDDKEALLEHASELGDRQSALELVAENTSHAKHMMHLQRSTYENLEKFREVKENIIRHQEDRDRDYEPRL